MSLRQCLRHWLQRSAEVRECEFVLHSGLGLRPFDLACQIERSRTERKP